MFGKNSFSGRRMISVFCMAMVCMFVTGQVFAAEEAKSDPSEKAGLEQLITDAAKTLDNFSADPDMSWFRSNVKNAKAVFIVPSLVKAGFVFGGSGGSGALLSRDEKTGKWSYPGFYSMGSGSFGFQAGFEKAEVVLMVMTQKGMDALLSTNFKLGADASISAGPVGAGAKVQTTDILSFSRSKGVFGGISLEGAVITPRDSWNELYYGKPVRTVDIVIRHDVKNSQADALRAAMTKIAK